MDHSQRLRWLFAAADRQYGVLHFAQAKTAGLHPMEFRRLMRTQQWERRLPGVYADPAKRGFEQDLSAAWLWAGADSVVSHRSAARVLNLDGVVAELPELTVLPGRRPTSSSVIIHRSELPLEDRRVWRSLPVTSAARTLVDLAGSISTQNLAMAVDCAWRRQLVPLDWLERRVRELGTQGRIGMAALGEVLEDCRSRGQPLDSALEVKLWWCWPRSGLLRPIPGFPYEDEFGQPGRMDFAYPAHRLAIECDGFQVHSQRDYFERDCTRLSRLAALGWRVIHVTWKQLEEPDQVFERIAAALRHRKPSMPAFSQVMARLAPSDGKNP